MTIFALVLSVLIGVGSLSYAYNNAGYDIFNPLAFDLWRAMVFCNLATLALVLINWDIRSGNPGRVWLME